MAENFSFLTYLPVAPWYKPPSGRGFRNGIRA
jgi:hypothetical protein